MATWAGRKYKLVRSENFEELLMAMGVTYLNRKLAKSLVFTCQLVQDESGGFTFHTVSTLQSFVINFKPGEEFEEKTSDGRLVRSTIVFDGDNKLVHTQKPITMGDVMTITREFSDKELIITIEYRGVVTKRYYKNI